MSTTRTLETKSLVATVEARAKEYQTLREKLETLRSAFQKIVGIDTFTGKSADAIKGFYRAQIDVVEAWLEFIDMQISFFKGIEGMAEDFDLGGKTLVDVPFLERDLAQGVARAFDIVDHQREDLQSIFSRVNDLVSLKVFSIHDFEERMEDAENKRKKTKNRVNELDQLLLEHYQQSSIHEQVIVGLMQEMFRASSQGGEVSPVYFNEIIYQQSEIHAARNQAKEMTADYLNYQKELEEHRELQREIEEMENRPWYEKTWDTVCTFTGELTGYYDAKRASTGIDPVTGEKLTTAERITAGSLAAAGFIPVVGWAGRAIKGGKTIHTLSKGAKVTDHALDAYQNTKAFDILKQTEYGIYGLASYNGFSEYITGKDMFGNELSEEKRNQSLTQGLFMLGIGGASVTVDRMQANKNIHNIFPTQNPPGTLPKLPKTWTINNAMTRMKNLIPEVRVVSEPLTGMNIPMFMKRSGGGTESLEGLGKGSKGNRLTGEGEVKPLVGKGEQYTNGRKNRLKPNIRYQTGEHDYFYETDSAGRISKFETNNLQLTTRENRLSHSKNTLGKIKGKDHAGHLAGDRFGGSPKLDNLVSQLSDVNLKQYKKIEDEWAAALKETPPKEVTINLEVIYSGNNVRPKKFLVKYTIDGEPFSEVLLN